MVLTEFILLAREELAVFIEVFVLSILAANDDESVEVVLYTLWIEAASEDEFEFIVLLTLLKLEEKDAEVDTILDAREDEAKFKEDWIEFDTVAADEESADMFEFAAIILSFIDWDMVLIEVDTTLILPDIDWDTAVIEEDTIPILLFIDCDTTFIEVDTILILPDIELTRDEDTEDIVLVMEDDTWVRLFCTNSSESASEEEFWFMLLYTREILPDILSAKEEDVDTILPFRFVNSPDNVEILLDTEFENDEEKLFICTANEEELPFILPVTEFTKLTNDAELLETVFIISTKLCDIDGRDEEFIPKNSLYKLLLLCDIAVDKEDEIFVIEPARDADVLVV